MTKDQVWNFIETKKPSPHTWMVSFRKSGGKLTVSVTFRIILRGRGVLQRLGGMLNGDPLGGMLWDHRGRLSTLVYGLISRQ